MDVCLCVCFKSKFCCDHVEVNLNPFSIPVVHLAPVSRRVVREVCLCPPVVALYSC